MSTALWLLAVQGALGALDTLYYHEWRLRLPETKSARRELRLHASRDFAYAIVFGSLAWAIYTVLLKPHTHRVPGMQLSAFTMIGGALALLVVASPSIVHAPWASMPLAGWASIFFSGMLALVIAYYFWYRGVRIIGPTRTAMFSNLQPLFAVAMAWAMLGERPTIWQGVGAITIMTGLILTRT